MCIDVSAAVIVRDGKALLARRSSHKSQAGKWEFPGGKREPGESLSESLAREMHEEFAVDCRIGRELIRSRYRYEQFTINLVAFETVLCEEPRILKDHDCIQWVPLASLLEYELSAADLPVARYLMALPR